MLVWFAIHYITQDTDTQFLLLIVFSFSVMFRLVYKTRKILKQIHEQSATSVQKENQ